MYNLEKYLIVVINFERLYISWIIFGVEKVKIDSVMVFFLRVYSIERGKEYGIVIEVFVIG